MKEDEGITTIVFKGKVDLDALGIKPISAMKGDAINLFNDLSGQRSIMFDFIEDIQAV